MGKCPSFLRVFGVKQSSLSLENNGNATSFAEGATGGMA